MILDELNNYFSFQYDQIFEARKANEEKVEKLVLDFDPDTKEELVVVHDKLVQQLKPHQAGGIKFMYTACFESVKRTQETEGSGCILAHCMGLGKSLQVVTLCHTLLSHADLGIKTVMVVCPLNTVLNWRDEFNKWLKDVYRSGDQDEIEIFDLTQ